MQLSKSDYMLFLKHPAWLWLKKHDPKKLPPVDDATQAIFDAGHMFESYAEQLFPGGVTLGFNDYGEYKSLPERTSRTLDEGIDIIFQGRFEYEQLTFICDVIQVVEGKTVDLIEIKSSTRAKIDHEYDLAFQKFVLEGCGYKVRNVSVVHVNGDYVRNGEVDPKAITATTDITDKVNAKSELTKNHIEQALKVANSDKCPDLSPSHARLGSFNEWLTIYRGLNTVEPGSIYDLCVIGAQKTGELEQLGIKNLVDIPDDFNLTPKQSLQVKAAKLGEPIIDSQKIKVFLDSLVFPLYFFDYETLSSTVPYFDSMRPYKQYPFQYSLHILDAPGAELKHMEYLHKMNSNPAEELSKTLQTQIGDSGSVITWNMSFEKGCNDLIGSMFPEYKQFYEDLNDRVVDLMTPFSKDWYVDKNFKGSASIKNVLPVIVPELSYKILGIQDGSTAQRLWMEAVLDGKRDGEKDEILNHLTEYCKLDTLAMVEIYNKLKELK